MGVVLAVWKFVSGFWSMLWTLITKYPLQCLAVIGVCILLWLTNKWAVERTTTRINKANAAYVQKVEKLADDRRLRILEIEANSKKAGEEAALEIGEKTKALEAAKSDYEQRLKLAQQNKKIEYVYVKVPGAKAESTQLIVEADGEVACRRLPSTFSESVNHMVDVMNGGQK